MHGQGFVDRGNERIVIRNHSQTTLFHDLGGRSLPGDDAFEHLSGEAVGERAGIHELDQRRHLARLHQRVGGYSVHVREAGDFAGPPLAGGLSGCTGRNGRFDGVE